MRNEKNNFVFLATIVLMYSNSYAKNSVDTQIAADRQEADYFSKYNNNEYVSRIEALNFITIDIFKYEIIKSKNVVFLLIKIQIKLTPNISAMSNFGGY